MKEWAEWFYKSKEWKETRKAYLESHFLCERCGEPAKIVHHKKPITRANIHDPNITLNWDNFEAVCQDCHNKEHHATKKKTVRYLFDVNGNMIPPISANRQQPEETEG